LPRATGSAFLLCAKTPFFNNPRWYLAGGTALALQMGHRQSVDLDFFTPQKRIDEPAIDRELTATLDGWRSNYRERGTIFGEIDAAKISLIAYPFFQPSPVRLLCGDVYLLVPEDIAAMKVIAVSQRGRKRDFVDLYWYCTKCEPLAHVVKRAVMQYPGQQKNINHIIKSLVYFADAEDDPMPKLFFRANWKIIKQYFVTEAERAARAFLEE